MSSLALEQPAAAQPGVCVGDVYALGRHRLACGDATDARAVAALLRGSKPNLVVTSPPYASQRAYDRAVACWDTLMLQSVAAVPLAEDAQMFFVLNAPNKNNEVAWYWLQWLQSMKQEGFRHAGMYVWDKLSGCPGNPNRRPRPCFEFVARFNRLEVPINKSELCKAVGQKGGRYGLRGKDNKRRSDTRPTETSTHKVMDNVIRLEVDKGNKTQHPAVFPVALPAKIIAAWQHAGTLVYDAFAGTASSLLACEQQNVTGFGMEVSPAYVTMALERWNKRHPSQQAKLVHR